MAIAPVVHNGLPVTAIIRAPRSLQRSNLELLNAYNAPRIAQRTILVNTIAPRAVYKSPRDFYNVIHTSRDLKNDPKSVKCARGFN